ncbi:MAG: HEAT repeat domain-containing protein [Eubacterium sp.]
MSYETIAIILFIIAIVLILLGFVWLYVVAQQQEDFLKKRDSQINEAKNLFAAILSSPTENSRQDEMKNLINASSKSNTSLLCIVTVYLDYNKNRENLSQQRQKILDEIYNEIEPIKRLREMLKKCNKYEKSYVLRLLSDFNATEAVDDIKEYLDSKNTTLQYNAGMTLSALGDEQSVITFLEKCENNTKFSHRIIIELFNNYSGDKAKLIRKYFETSKNIDDYMKATIIKAVKDDCLESLKDIYIEGFYGKSQQIRVACVKAMASLGTADLEQQLITASKDKDWVMRLSSLPGLKKICSAECIEAVKQITADEQWWVRKRAAQCLVEMDSSMKYVEEVIKGYDRYAADAVKECLYKVR